MIRFGEVVFVSHVQVGDVQLDVSDELQLKSFAERVLLSALVDLSGLRRFLFLEIEQLLDLKELGVDLLALLLLGVVDHRRLGHHKHREAVDVHLHALRVQRLPWYRYAQSFYY